ncbi:MAG: ribosome biogenesis GTPase Der [Acidimicrobiia bacterium]|nr:ribosome biogenesis GTPase Der [Acidimicrobiia bacterium]
MSRLPVVAVVGRPNVGKSTLVNRIVGGRPAVVQEKPGVTRDRREFTAEWGGRGFLLVDTGGWELKPGEALGSEIRQQAEAAVSGADAVLFVTDATTGITEDDAGVADLLRRAEVPIVFAANKVDDSAKEIGAMEMWGAGLGKPLPISAFHGRGVGDLLDALVAVLPDFEDDAEADVVPSVAVIGRPNVGKSTLLNRLAGSQRVIVSEMPGTTRDPVDQVIDLDGREFRFVDTAGMRRKPQIREDADYYAVLRAQEVLARADVALLLIDASEGITHQDQRIASEAAEAGVALVIVLNKWDVVDEESRLRVEADLGDRFGFVGWAPVLRMSAMTGSRVGRIRDVLDLVLENRSTRISTGALNRMVREWTGAHPPPVRGGRRPRIQYVVQAGQAPPTFIVFVSGGDLGDDYLRFLEGRLRGAAEFTGTPVQVFTRAKERRR